MLKPFKTESTWGSTEFSPALEDSKMFITIRGPRGGDPRFDWISALEALALSEYLKYWALTQFKTD